MARSKAARSVDAELAVVRRLADADEHAAREGLRETLGHKHWLVVKEAALLVQERGFVELAPELGQVWGRFAQDGDKLDPGCGAKQAALEALDRLAGKLLADPESPVRSGAVQALGHYGERAISGLLVYKLKLGDDDPQVLIECCAALLQLAPDLASPLLDEELEHADEVRREAAALALGQSSRPAAAQHLIEWLEEHRYGDRLELGLKALGLSRLDVAREYLLGQVAGESHSVASMALRALATHRYDPRLAERAQAAVRKNRRAKLQPVFQQVFGAGRGRETVP